MARKSREVIDPFGPLERLLINLEHSYRDIGYPEKIKEKSVELYIKIIGDTLEIESNHGCFSIQHSIVSNDPRFYI